MVSIKELKINEDIKAKTVSLVDENGELLGVFSQEAALNMAIEKGLDLVEMSPNSDPPVCRLADYGKLAYREQKKKTKVKNKSAIIKEIQFTPSIGEHDFVLKLKKIKEFILDGYKVKISMRFRGREVEHLATHQDKINQILEELKDDAKVESRSQVEGRQIILVLIPNPKS